jgi:hypothetical protein
MDSSCALLFSALREMEMRLGERLTGRSTLPTCCAATFVQRTAMYADDEGLAFDSEPFYDNLDEELFVDPVVDAAPASDHTAVTGLTFATPACAVRDQFTDGLVFDDLDCEPVFDTYSNDRADGLVFDTDSDTPDNGPVFATKTDYDHVAVAAIEFTKSEFDTDFAFSDKGPSDLFTARLGAVLDEGPLFNEESEPVEEDLTFVNSSWTPTPQLQQPPRTCLAPIRRNALASS